MYSQSYSQWLGAHWRSLVGVTFAWILAKLAIMLAREHRLTSMMPPGPPGLPLLGNLLQISKLPWLRFDQLSQQYGKFVR